MILSLLGKENEVIILGESTFVYGQWLKFQYSHAGVSVCHWTLTYLLGCTFFQIKDPEFFLRHNYFHQLILGF